MIQTHVLKAPVCAVLDVFIHLSIELPVTLCECKGTDFFHIRQFNFEQEKQMCK